MTVLKNILRYSLLLVPLAASAVQLDGLGFDPTTETNRVASAYLAPENMFLFRMRYPDGSYREFDRDYATPAVLRGGDGWRGRISGDRIRVKTGPHVKGGPAEFVFEKGRLVAFAQGDRKYEFPYDSPREATGGRPPYYFGEDVQKTLATGVSDSKAKKPKMDRQVAKVLAGKWKKSGRLDWPFQNPNENGFLYASIAMLSLCFFFARSKAFWAVGGVVFLAACVPLIMTASRGAFLALAIGLVPLAALKFRQLVKSKMFWIIAALVVTLASGWFLTHNSGLLTRGFKGKSTWSNQVRLEMWKAAPQMIAEAPGGWYFAHVGRAYMDWYSPLETVSMPGSLMNEHLTRIVAYNWLGRFAYVWGWLLGLGLLAAFAWRTKNAVAFGMWIMYAVASWFNPVLTNRLLWIVPGAAVAVCLSLRPWRGVKGRCYLVVAAVTALLACGALVGIRLAGNSDPARGYPVRAEGKRVCVKNLDPSIWIVDDGQALGGVMACKDIRGYYAYRPDAPGVGYVRHVADLPKKKIHRLVLAGKAGAAWLKAFGERVEKEREEALKYLPDELVFITPTIPPSDIPPPYLQSCKVRLVIGEFAARYEEEYASPPPWVTIVPSMELYIMGWMEYAVSW